MGDKHITASVKKYRILYGPHIFSMNTPSSTSVRITGDNYGNNDAVPLQVIQKGDKHYNIENSIHVMNFYMQIFDDKEEGRIEFSQKTNDPDIPHWITMLTVPKEVLETIVEMLKRGFEPAPIFLKPRKIRIKTRKNNIRNNTTKKNNNTRNNNTRNNNK